MKKLLCYAIALTVSQGFGAAQWMDRALESERRAEILTAAMTLEEKADELLIHYANEPELYAYFTNRLAHGRTFGAIMKVTGAKQARELQELAQRTHRLKVPFIFHEDVTHGFRTVLPVGLGTACSWNEELVEACEAMAAKEAAAAGFHLTYAPMCDISDDPRWGRICETSGEDPYLSSRIIAARVRGFRRHLASCIKHYAAYGALRAGRDYHPGDCSLRELNETHLEPYRAAIAEGVDAVMCAYTPFEADNLTVNNYLCRTVLREELGFKGELMTDWQTIKSCERYGISPGPAESARRAIEAGIDADMRSDIYGDWLPRLVREGKVDEKLVDAACVKCLTLKFRMGLFDDPFARGCDEAAEAAAQITSENRALAREAVRQGAVLLENRGGILPLPLAAKVAVTGPLADSPHDQLGDWPCFGKESEAVTPLKAAQEVWGANFVSADEAEVVIYCAGERKEWGGEHHSRLNPNVPAEQMEEMRAFARKGKKVVAVVMSCRPLLLAETKSVADAILFSFFPGTEGGHGLVDLLTGAANPSGRLVQTFPRELGQIPLSYRERRPWMYDEWVDGSTAPLYPFGYGLSYTTFSCSKPTYADGAVRVKVSNTGSREGATVVQLYLRHDLSSIVPRECELKGFRRVTLKPGESKDVAFAVGDNELKIYTADRKWVVEPGPVTAFVGFDAATTNAVSFAVAR